MTGLFNENTWQLLDRYGILLGDILMTLSIIGAGLGFIKRHDLRRWLTRNQFPSVGGSPEHNRWQGMVFTVSRGNVPLWVIAQVRPSAVGLLATEASRGESEAIRQTAAQQGIAVFSQNLDNPDDPAECKRKTAQLIHDLRSLSLTDIAIDITGGKVPMSLGAFMAAEEHGCPSLYVTAGYKDNKPDMTTARLIAISEPQP